MCKGGFGLSWNSVSKFVLSTSIGQGRKHFECKRKWGRVSKEYLWTSDLAGDISRCVQGGFGLSWNSVSIPLRYSSQITMSHASEHPSSFADSAACASVETTAYKAVLDEVTSLCTIYITATLPDGTEPGAIGSAKVNTLGDLKKLVDESVPEEDARSEVLASMQEDFRAAERKGIRRLVPIYSASKRQYQIEITIGKNTEVKTLAAVGTSDEQLQSFIEAYFMTRRKEVFDLLSGCKLAHDKREASKAAAEFKKGLLERNREYERRYTRCGSVE